MPSKVALVTGAANRLGKQIACELHNREIDIALHCGQSTQQAEQLCEQFNHIRSRSAFVIQADLNLADDAKNLIDSTLSHFQRLNYLVNNAAIFYPNDFSSSDEPSQLSSFLSVNLFRPIELMKMAFPFLKKQQGAIVNIIDIYANAGLADHCAYVASKEALLKATQHFAYHFSPDVRVNGVSPGAILWPESDLSADFILQRSIVEKTALKRKGNAEDISKAVAFLLLDAKYSTGSIINVDGGRRLYI